MFKRLQNRIAQKETELKVVKADLKKKGITGRCLALMKLHPLKIEIAELKVYLRKKIAVFNKRLQKNNVSGFSK